MGNPTTELTNTMLITVAICTWNRAALLDQTLAEMRNLSVPEGVDWELLVVNNKCTDATDETIAKYSQSLPIRRLYEPEAGVSNARNCAVREARGEYIMWTDDDVLVAPNWMTAYVAAFHAFPDAAIFGGDIKPWFEGDSPAWLTDNWQVVKNAYATRDFGNSTAPITKFTIPYGANCAIRTSEQRRYIFDPALGNNGSRWLRCEETNLILRMLEDGVPGRWVPDAPVRHYIPRERQTLAYLRQYYYGLGQSTALVDPPNDVPQLLGKPRFAWRMAIASEVLFQWNRLLGRKTRCVPHLCSASGAWGLLLAPKFGETAEVRPATTT